LKKKNIFEENIFYRVGFGVGLGYQVGFRVRVEAETLLVSMSTRSKSRLARSTSMPVPMPMPNKITFNETSLLCLSKKIIVAALVMSIGNVS
jgi:hypothetical protein